jgi:hypothetical protein
MHKLLLVGIVAAGMAAGQTVSTQILGLVTDQTGSAVPGASVQARHVATGDMRTTQSNETGNYVFPILEVGAYEVTCTAAGFKTEVRSGITLELQQKARIDFQLQVGAQTEKIEVVSTTPLLRTEDATLGSVVEHKRVVDLPLNQRNFGQLATLTPGVTFTNARMGLDGQGTIGTRAMPGQIIGVTANGQRDITPNITLDGVNATDGFKSAMLFSPSIEAIEEFKIQSAVYSAEYGMNSGAQMNVIIKSGTNQLHGTAFEFVRNDKFDARGFFLAPTANKNKLRRNQFGGVLSGPLKRDKTFWLVNYEGRRENRASPGRATVATMAMRAGDFSELLEPGNRWYPTTAVANLTIRRPGDTAPFPNNIIPRSLINPVSINLLTYKKTSPFADGGFIPPPNIDAEARAARSPQNLAGTNDQILNSDQVMGRMDHRFGDNDRIFGRYVIVPSDWVNDPLTRAGKFTSAFRAQNFGAGYTKILNAYTVNDLRFGINRIRANQLAIQTETDFTHRDLGFDFRVVGDGNRTLTPREEGVPNVNITGYAGSGSGNVTFNINSTYEIADSLIINRGRHNFKLGGQWRNGPTDNEASNLPRGQITFTRDIVGVPDAFAAFLLGIPLNANSAEGAPLSAIRQQKYGFYWLDDFKATSKLTINFGIRWDWYGGVTDANGKIRNLSFAKGVASTVGGQFIPVLAPDPNIKQVLYDVNWKQFMPRLGIAYRINDTTVLRTGAGLYYSPQQTNNFNILGLNPPFSGSVVFQNDRTRPTATIQNPFLGSPAGGGPAALVALGWWRPEKGNRSMYLNNSIWQWSLELEKSIGQELVFGAAYAGNAANHIDMPVQNFNNPDPGLGAVQGRRPFQSYADSRSPNTLLPLGTVRMLESWTSANYNALQLRADKRYARGMSLHAAFNYQHANSIGYSVNEGGPFGTNYTQDPRNRKADYGRSQIDQRFRMTFSHVWELPWFRSNGGPANWILGGWALNGLVSLSSGLPVTVNQNGDSQNTGPQSGAVRPHVVAGQKVDRVMDGRTINRWFNTAAFVRSKCDGCAGEGIYLGPKGYGNAGVSLFDAPGQKTWDISLHKEFRVREGHRLQFRYEAFNFFNTPQFNAPSRSLGAADFGRINGTVINNREMQFGMKYIF